MKKFTLPILFLSAIMLSACSLSLLPQQQQQEATMLYTLDAGVPAEKIKSVPVVVFGKIAIPSYIDTQQIVTRESNSVVTLSETHQWAEPVERAVQRTIPLQVSTRVAGKKLKNFSKISVIFSRFDGSLDSEVTLSARIILQKSLDASVHEKEVSSIFSITVPVKSPTYPAYVEAMSTALSSLSQAIAEQIIEK